MAPNMAGTTFYQKRTASCDLGSLRPFASSWADSLAKAAVYTERAHEYRCLRPKNQKALVWVKEKGLRLARFIVSSRGGPSFGL